jgi:hypothetical protein
VCPAESLLSESTECTVTDVGINMAYSKMYALNLFLFCFVFSRI